MFVSILYASGQIVLALASIQGSGSHLHPYMDLFGLFVIAVGTGGKFFRKFVFSKIHTKINYHKFSGIKPCVSPFGGDQFEPHEGKMLSLFFSCKFLLCLSDFNTILSILLLHQHRIPDFNVCVADHALYALYG
jgi:hypothetical protein